MIILMLLVGFILWYFYYGIECFINGGSLGRNPYLMHFPLFWQELTWILPGGLEKRYDFITDQLKGNFPDSILEDHRDLFLSLPGVSHFLFTHVFIPLIPTLIFILK